MPVVLRGPAAAVCPPYPLSALPVKSPHKQLERVSLDWMTGTGVTNGKAVPIPVGMVQRRALRPTWEPDVFRSTSTGLACGNCRDEALLHGLFEVVERDALHADEVSAGQRRTLIDPETVQDTYCRSLIRRILRHASASN